MKRSRMRRFGISNRSKDRRLWDRQLKEWFLEQGITRCESCGTDYQVTVMHALKRDYIKTREDYFRAALVCWEEHLPYDEGKGDDPHGKMAAFVDELIERR